MGTPTIYPTGATLFSPDKCWCGYTLFIAMETGPALVDMNGRVVHLWKGLHGFPAKLLPGGHVMGSPTGVRTTFQLPWCCSTAGQKLRQDIIETTNLRAGSTDCKDAESVSRLRALRSSHYFDEYWTFHEAQEHE